MLLSCSDSEGDFDICAFNLHVVYMRLMLCPQDRFYRGTYEWVVDPSEVKFHIPNNHYNEQDNPREVKT